MTGFNFLQDQHYLFLLLFALQRFTDKDWGFLTGFEQMIDDDTLTLDLEDCWTDNHNREQAVFVGEKTNMLKPRYGLNGRATGVLYGSVEMSGNKQDVVAKLSWPEKNCYRERVFVDEAKKRLHDINDYNPCDYLPTILAAKEFSEFESGLLREAVLWDEVDYTKTKFRSRMPYLLVMPKYEPISALTKDWNAFMAAFFALFYCTIPFCLICELYSYS